MGFRSCVIGADLWSFGPLDILDGKLYGGISYKRANFTVGMGKEYDRQCSLFECMSKRSLAVRFLRYYSLRFKI
jgi:hypothetical protein